MEIASQADFSYEMRQRYMKQDTALLKSILVFGIETGELGKLNAQELDSLVFVMLSGMHGMEMVVNNNFEMLEPAVKVLTRSRVHGLKK